MTVSIRSNIGSLKAIRSLSDTTQRLNSSFERLSTGKRINRAVDDAASLAVASSLTSKSRILNRARLNVSDGISALDIASGTATSISNLLQRMSELAEQGANGSYSSTQRKALDTEYQALDKEIRRIADTTTFNGINLFKGQKSNRAAQTIGSVLATASALTASSSGDGRYLTYLDSSGSKIVQLDTQTGQTTTLVNASATNISTSSSGDIVAFSSTSNINGLNSSGRDQVFTYNRLNGSISRITNSSAGEAIGDVAISADGSTVAFSSNTTYNSSGGVTGVLGSNLEQLHTYDRTTSTFKTNSDISSIYITDITLSSNGQYAAYNLNDVLSFSDTSGNSLTYTDGIYNFPTNGGAFVSNTGKLYFISAENVGGVNAGLTSEVFEYDPRSTQTRKLTNNSADATIRGISVNNDGSSLSFLTSGNFTGENSGALYTQSYKYDLISNQLSQVTGYSELSSLDNAFSEEHLSSADGNTFYYINGVGEINKIDRSPAALSLNIETGTGLSGQIATAIDAVNGALKGLGAYQVTSQSSSRGALDLLTLNIERLGTFQGIIGAAQSRLKTANNIISATGTQVDSAKSRITDTDIAEESAKATRLQILQTASVAVLAQANLQPQLALRLLNL